MRQGQRAVVAVDAYGGREFTGRVDSLAAATGARFSLIPPDNATGNFVKVVQRVPVKIVLDAPQSDAPLLRPGLSVQATVYTDGRP
jgi:membrane fusion protein (multidrug efflux system)